MTPEQEKIIDEYKATHLLLHLPVDSNEELDRLLSEHCPDTMDNTEEWDGVFRCKTHKVEMPLSTKYPAASGIHECPVCGQLDWC
jgi:hypothetical protein